jgi:hypothetical protein
MKEPMCGGKNQRPTITTIYPAQTKNINAKGVSKKISPDQSSRDLGRFSRFLVWISSESFS